MKRLILASAFVAALAAHSLAQSTAPDTPISDAPQSQPMAESPFVKLTAIADEFPNAVWVMNIYPQQYFKFFALDVIAKWPASRSLRAVVYDTDYARTSLVTWQGGAQPETILRRERIAEYPVGQPQEVLARTSKELDAKLAALSDVKEFLIVRTMSEPSEEILATIRAAATRLGASVHIIDTEPTDFDFESKRSRNASGDQDHEIVQRTGAARRAIAESGGTWREAIWPSRDVITSILNSVVQVDGNKSQFISPDINFRGLIPILAPEDITLSSRWSGFAHVSNTIPDPILKLSFAKDHTVTKAELVNPPDQLASLSKEFREALLNSAYTWRREPSLPDTVTITFLVPAPASK